MSSSIEANSTVKSRRKWLQLAPNRRMLLLAVVAALLGAVAYFGPAEPTTPPLSKPRVARPRKTKPAAAEPSPQVASLGTAPSAEASAPAQGQAAQALPAIETQVLSPAPDPPAPAAAPVRRLPSSYATTGPAKPGTLQSPMEALREGEEPQAPVPTNISSKIRRYAEVVVSQYDVDNDGRLSPTEYAAMPGEPAMADLNADGILEAHEIAARVAVYSRRRLIRLMPVPVEPTQPTEPGAAPVATAAPSGDPSAAELELARRARQFYVPERNLPTGLPDWFLASDTNGDAQISMAEFSARWSGTELHRFEQYDTDRDGLITAAEGRAINTAAPSTPSATDAAALR
ncbi:MAG: hypothetical protein K1X74_02220 [Pirellulales bacterium]|nr:hypothetical protein [Pirellulales bacterium]